MNVSLFQAAAALNANARWQEMISENLAASSLPGFKKQELSFATLQAGLMPGASGNHFSLTHARPSVNFSPGEIKVTGVNTDFAIEGSGFFEVSLPNGTTAYTRDGEFHLNAQGQLVTKEGYGVIGDGGPIQLDPANPTPLSVSPTGEISQGGELRGRLKVVDFNDPHLLTPVSSGYFLASDPKLQASNVATPSIRQGSLEAANTSPVAEMANLITVMRTFEANQRLMQLQDERMGRVISDLGTPN
jgi:flagellar basal-body rod protein FlgF